MQKILFLILMVINMDAIELKKYEKELNLLSEGERRVIVNKGTEAPFSGKLLENKESGVYVCKVCKTPLFSSSAKFNSGTGWPSFDDMIDKNVKELPDADGRRSEIVCATCGAHLGHVFYGEGFTNKSTRHCVNSISLDFYKKAYFAGGCFWGVEYYLEQLDGVLEVTSGYMGGESKNPTYQEVCYNNTGHIEAVEVLYDSSKISYEELAKVFFEIHDPTQTDGQGPDIGSQYLSAIFTSDVKEREVIKALIEKLEANGYKVATKVLDDAVFYKAENYHQNYYKNKGTKPYCHGYTKRF
ncbi:MAG: bifunctional methionine sulfoxide reductase B/A protein [Sulfurimonadaceae bacterium]|jgi:peptide methionine sulfoxide reductase msrA/msrB|nr:bifunctional methionine sulfoxide reductase B/A protein [Sulfurimonadaceae bacterium]